MRRLGRRVQGTLAQPAMRRGRRISVPVGVEARAPTDAPELPRGHLVGADTRVTRK